MKGKLILLTVLIVLFIAFVGIKYLILGSQNQIGRIKIISSPRATVFLNSVASGQTPFDRELKSGEYMIKLIPQGEATSAASWQGKVKISQNSLSYVNRELGSSDITSAGEIFTIAPMEKKPKDSNLGEISVETDPAGAIVYLDNDEKGVASLIMTDVPRGQHELSIYIPGFFRRTQKINVEGRYRVNAVFKLAIDESQKPPTSNAQPTPATDSAKPGKKIFVKVVDTPTGFLRVRKEASSDSEEIGRVKPGDQLEVVDQADVWYQVKYDGEKTGWVSSEFVEKEVVGTPTPIIKNLNF